MFSSTPTNELYIVPMRGDSRSDVLSTTMLKESILKIIRHFVSSGRVLTPTSISPISQVYKFFSSLDQAR